LDCDFALAVARRFGLIQAAGSFYVVQVSPGARCTAAFPVGMGLTASNGQGTPLDEERRNGLLLSSLLKVPTPFFSASTSQIVLPVAPACDTIFLHKTISTPITEGRNSV
jgi:hypothetical protein